MVQKRRERKVQGWLTGEGMAEENCGFEQAAEAKKKGTVSPPS
jgi:hypothetical protein